MAMQKSDLDRQFFLDVDRAGFVVVRDRGVGMSHGGLPVFSTDTYDQAMELIVLHCKLASDGSGLYRLNDPPRSVEDLSRVSDLFRTWFEKLNVKKLGDLYEEQVAESLAPSEEG